MLLEEGWGYSAGVGGSCSTHNLRSVDPHPRGVGRPEAGRASADVEPPPGGCGGTRREPETAGQRSGRGRRGRPLGRGRPARQPGPRQTSRSRARQQLSVHGADISGPSVGTRSGNRWDSKASSRLATSVRRSCQRHGHRRPARPLSTAAPQPAVTLKAPTRPAIPAARSSIILASWRRVRQFSGMPLRPYSAPASCP